MLIGLTLLGLTLAVAQDTGPPAPPVGTVGQPAVRARPIPPVNWVTARDFPEGTVAPGQSLEASTRLDVDAAGRITGCTVMTPSGSPAYDQKLCQLVSARGRYEPAQSADGKAMPAVSVLRFRITG